AWKASCPRSKRLTPWPTPCAWRRRSPGRRRSSSGSRAAATRTSTSWRRRSGGRSSEPARDDLRRASRAWRARPGGLLHRRRSLARGDAAARAGGGGARRRRHRARRALLGPHRRRPGHPARGDARPRAGVVLVHLVAPTSTPGRVRLIARRSRGFIYVVSLTGVTGERRELPRDLEAQIRTLRRLTTKPVCVGFGIGHPDQVAAVGRLADGVIVGSAIARLI